MKKIFGLLAFCFCLCFSLPVLTGAQIIPDPALMTAISAIKVIDNHAHPLRVLKEGERDREWGDLSFHALETTASDPGSQMSVIPFRLRPNSPEYIATWKVLYGLPQGPPQKGLIQEVIQAKKQIMQEQGDSYPSRVLDKIGVETMLANRVVMDRSLPAPRFRWVPYVDALMFPFSNEEARITRPDLTVSYDSLERLLKTHLKDLGLTRLPPTLLGYLSRVVSPTLERLKQKGALAFKFQTAYVRTLDIANPSAEQAGRVYDRFVQGGRPTAGEYKSLQDYLFRYISREAGRLDVVVHIHTGFGIGQYFDIEHSNSLLLESVFNDPMLRKTRFVLLHGGWPFTKQTAALLLKPNVYVDFSAITYIFYPRETSGVVRNLLEISPDKVLFSGTDGFEIDPKMPFLNWEELAYIGTSSARQVLALALTEMIQDHEITPEEALAMAKKVLRENAINLYKLGTP